MGQWTHGLSYGIRDIDIPDREQFLAIIEDCDLHGPPPPTYESEITKAPFWGYRIAAGVEGRNDEDGCPPLSPFRVRIGVPEGYAKAILAAEAKWDKFAKHCHERGLDLPPADIWLVLTEVA